MIDFIKAQPNFVDRLLQHIANASISELLLKIISVEEIPEAQGIVTVSFFVLFSCKLFPSSIFILKFKWLGGQGLIPKLIERLDPNLEVEVGNEHDVPKPKPSPEFNHNYPFGKYRFITRPHKLSSTLLPSATRTLLHMKLPLPTVMP